MGTAGVEKTRGSVKRLAHKIEHRFLPKKAKDEQNKALSAGGKRNFRET